MSQNIIEVKQLVKSYDDFAAVKGISFEVERGEIFGFLGPNGAGKSTTINMLCTTVKPSDGTALVNGYDIVKDQSKVRESIGIIFQENSLDIKMTAKENLMLHCRLYAVPKKEREHRIDLLLKIVELNDRKDKMVEFFSGGMKRRLEIARGLLHYPKVLFLDEPMVGLDPQTRARIWEYIKMLKEEHGTTIFLTTHYMDEAEVCSRIAIIDHGEVIAIDTPANLKQSVGGDVVELGTENNQHAIIELKQKYSIQAVDKDGLVSFQIDQGTQQISSLIKELETPIVTLNLRRPTLNDVFLKLTGRQIREEELTEKDIMRERMRRGRH
ncbi:ABC transporter ATP-binding protein [Desulfuribacillus stibiiarsenatis]|uniref:ABC transporter ATP-binding protein n=1 Tax=Desulfuribacillus stibiiarsenatis TaxID=1390249 RepID=A0A1E5L8G8_9FIRM|nr:ATP-binding cassette domain-containing protein [Desulfuribacillus stibiiarsenatis]OEH86431.1 ABC transporter ATP-binding protein [Desulfuribacillus stibiiarsenatis]